MGIVGGDPTGLAHGGATLRGVARSTRAGADAVDGAARSCAGALDGPLSDELDRFAAATAAFVGALAVHVEATGWLAENVGADLARADGVP